MKHHPDFYANDERPQFSTLSFEKQQEVICDFMQERLRSIIGCHQTSEYVIEAISQMKPDSTISDLLLYIARAIEKNYPQNDWCI